MPGWLDSGSRLHHDCIKRYRTNKKHGGNKVNVVISTRGGYASVYVDGECKLFHAEESEAEDLYAELTAGAVA